MQGTTQKKPPLVMHCHIPWLQEKETCIWYLYESTAIMFSQMMGYAPQKQAQTKHEVKEMVASMVLHETPTFCTVPIYI